MEEVEVAELRMEGGVTDTCLRAAAECAVSLDGILG